MMLEEKKNNNLITKQGRNLRTPPHPHMAVCSAAPLGSVTPNQGASVPFGKLEQFAQNAINAQAEI